MTFGEGPRGPSPPLVPAIRGSSLAQIPTVRIVHPTAKGGYARINLSDFDPAVHVLFDVTAVIAPPDNSGNTDNSADVSRETPAPKKRGRPRKAAVGDSYPGLPGYPYTADGRFVP